MNSIPSGARRPRALQALMLAFGLVVLNAVLLLVASSAHAANIWTMPRRLGGSYIFIKGEIVAGDDQMFAALNPLPPVFVRPSGPGGQVPPALNIADMIAQRGYSTMSTGLDGECDSSCAIIWLSGYATHAIAEYTSKLGFHSCYENDQDSIPCDAMIATHLVRYGFTPQQALVLVSAAPHENMHYGTVAWAQTLGFQPQSIADYPGAEGTCAAHFCVAVAQQQPMYPTYPMAQPFYPARPMYPYYARPYYARPFVRPFARWR